MFYYKLSVGGEIKKVSTWREKKAQIFARGYYLLQDANSFPGAKLKENCEELSCHLHLDE